MSKERITVETLRAGQPRPYADSIYHYRVTIEWQGLVGYKNPDAPFVPRPQLAQRIVDRILYGLCGPWQELGNDPFQRRLDRKEMTAPGVWEVVVVEPYID
jgi:hypothetical protein